MTRLGLAAALMIVALAAAGCGRKGPLEPPPQSGSSAPSTQRV